MRPDKKSWTLAISAPVTSGRRTCRFTASSRSCSVALSTALAAASSKWSAKQKNTRPSPMASSRSICLENWTPYRNSQRRCVSAQLQNTTWAICTRRAGKLYKARSRRRLYRSQIFGGSQKSRKWSQILQENMRWEALAEICTMHSFAPFSWDPFSKLIFLFENHFKKCIF